MRPSLALLTFFLIVGIGNSRVLAEQEFPYSATIIAETADVHSGPGAAHYVTCQLARGTKVEVFRRDPDGWLAIRPSENEFSLVLAKYVLANFREGLGRVSSDGVQAWVGSLLPHTAEPLWQVQFRKGEVVRIIGDTRVEDAHGQTHLWYRIAPPAGEFRWIHESAFQRSGQAEIARIDKQEKNSLDQQFISQSSATQPIEDSLATAVLHQSAVGKNNSNGSITPKPFEPVQIDTADLTEGIESQRVPAQSQRMAESNQTPRMTSSNAQTQGDWIVASDTGTIGRISTFPVSQEHAAPNSPTNDRAKTISQPENIRQHETENSVQSIPSALRAEQTTVTEQLRETEIQLTLAALQPADQWQLETVRQSVMAISRQARSEAERVQVNSLLEKIGAFEKLKKRYEAASRNSLQFQNPRSVSPPIRQAAVSDQQAALSESSSGNLLDPVLNNMERSTKIPEQTSNVQPIGTGIDESSTGLLPANYEQVVPANLNAQSDPDAAEGLNNVEYDAQGWLNRLYQADGQGAMGYVVQDKSGKILKTILPAPGVNLDRYLEQEVGIFGRRGFNVKYNLPHVTADRLILLERHR
jgi:hypothetical protein